jgi:transposase
LCEATKMNAYSLDLRLKVLDAVDRGIPRKEEVVGTFGVSMPTLERHLRRRREGAGQTQWGFATSCKSLQRPYYHS